MLKQGVKTINTEFIWTHALSHLSFIQFRLYATSFLGLLLFLMLISKSKKTLEMSLDLIPSFKGLGSRFQCELFINFSTVISFKRNMAKKDACCAYAFSSLHCNISFFTDFLHHWWLLKVKKRINKALSKHSKQFLLLFCFLV